MSADFVLCFTADFLNRASASAYPALLPGMSGTWLDPESNASIAWSVGAAPQFQFDGAEGTQSFALHFPLVVSASEGSGQPVKASADVTAICSASIGAGKLLCDVLDLEIRTGDPVLQAVLQAKKLDIVTCLNPFLALVSIDLGMVEGVHYAGYALQIGNRCLVAAAGLQMPVLAPSLAAPSTDFELLMSEALVQAFLAANWWATVGKAYDDEPATIYLNAYESSLDEGVLSLTLHMSGSVDKASAKWSVAVDPAVLQSSCIANGRAILIARTAMPSPGVKVKPANWHARGVDVASPLFLGQLTKAVEAELSGDVLFVLAGALDSRPLVLLPVLNGSDQGVPVTVTPCDLVVQGQGKQLVVSGHANVTAG